MKKIWVALAAMTMAAPMHAQLVINEVMQSNIDCIMDDMNEFPDSWVELYNNGESSEQLSNYRIGLTSDAQKAWALPASAINKGYRVLIYCDKAATGMHTDFRLESGKNGEIYLFKNNKVVDKLTKMKKQPAPNIAYGRKTDGSDTWGYMAIPTPGGTNCGSTCKDLLGDVVFSEPGRVLENAQTLKLTLSLPDGAPAGTVIRYTTDGSEPMASSLQYTAPITISTSQVVRAKPFCTGYLSPRSVTQSYIFHGRKMTLPVISIVTKNVYFYDNKQGILVKGNYNSSQENYKYNWRRPINLELFTAAGSKSQLNQLCETRVMGGASRDNMMKSMAIYANKRFGTKRLKYEFFPDQRPGITDYKSLALRNAGNDFDYLYMRDAVIQRSVAAYVDLDWQAWRPAIIYINGKYNGMLNIRERSNEDNIYTNYEGLEDIDMIENGWELKEGDWEHFNRFKAFYQEHGHTMAEYETWMDCKEYINLMIMNLFYNNQDFPGNNIVWWRPRTETGRWRWVAKDTDFGIGLYGSSATYKTFEWFYNPNYDKDHAWANKPEHTRLFRRLMEDADFQREFIDRAAIYLGDFLSEKNIRLLWDDMYNQIKTEYPHHRKLVNEWWPNYTNELNTAHKWLNERIPSFYQQISDFYKVGNPVPLTINATMAESDRNAMTLTFNGVRLTEACFDGKFFKNRSMQINGVLSDGREVKAWNIVQHQGTATTAIQQSGATLTMALPDCDKVEITAVIGEPTAITQPDTKTWHWSFAAGTLQVEQVEKGTKVCVYDLLGRILHRTTATGAPLSFAVSAKTCILKVGDEAAKVTDTTRR